MLSINIVCYLRLIFKFQKKNSTVTTSAGACYNSDTQVIRLSKNFQPSSSLPQTQSHLSPNMAVKNVSSLPVVPKMFPEDPLYGCTQENRADYDPNAYEAIDVHMSDKQEEYGRDYECV